MNELEIVLEAKLTKAQRDALPDSAFGIPSTRSYPLDVDNDDSHLHNAIAMFHFCPKDKRTELATNIVKFIKKSKSDIKIASNNMLTKYTKVPEEMLKEPETKKKAANESMINEFISSCESMQISYT